MRRRRDPVLTLAKVDAMIREVHAKALRSIEQNAHRLNGWKPTRLVRMRPVYRCGCCGYQQGAPGMCPRAHRLGRRGRA